MCRFNAGSILVEQTGNVTRATVLLGKAASAEPLSLGVETIPKPRSPNPNYEPQNPKPKHQMPNDTRGKGERRLSIPRARTYGNMHSISHMIRLIRHTRRHTRAAGQRIGEHWPQPSTACRAPQQECSLVRPRTVAYGLRYSTRRRRGDGADGAEQTISKTQSTTKNKTQGTRHKGSGS